MKFNKNKTIAIEPNIGMNSFHTNYLMALFILIVATFLLSCEKLNLQTADNNIPVIESYIHPGDSIIVLISRQVIYESNETESKKLDDLTVYLETDSITTILQNIGEGYYLQTGITISEGERYEISFEYNDKTVLANTSIPLKPTGFTISNTIIEAFSFGNFIPSSGSKPTMPSNVAISWSNPDNYYHMIVVENIEEEPELISEDTDRPTPVFRNAPTQSEELTLNPMTFTYYGRHRIILYRLNSEYAALYEQLDRLSSLDLTAPPTNVENGLGIFTGVNADTIYIDVVEQ